METLEDSGNVFVNSIFEANLTPKIYDKGTVLKDSEKEERKRSKFIKHKYKKLKYFDEVLYHQQVLKVLHRKHEQRKLREAEKEGEDAPKDTKRDNKDDSDDNDESTSNDDDSENSESENGEEYEPRRSARDIMKDSRAKMREKVNSKKDLLEGNNSNHGGVSPGRMLSSRRMMIKSSSMRNLSMSSVSSSSSLSLSLSPAGNHGKRRVPDRTSSFGSRFGRQRMPNKFGRRGSNGSSMSDSSASHRNTRSVDAKDETHKKKKSSSHSRSRAARQ